MLRLSLLRTSTVAAVGVIAVLTACSPGDVTTAPSAHRVSNSGASADASTGKIDVCQIDQDGIIRKLSVNANALAAHLANGGTLAGPLTLPAEARFTASNTWDAAHAPSLAFDRDLLTNWNAGAFPTQWIEVDFGSPQRFSVISAKVNQTPTVGTTNHDVTLDGEASFSWSGETHDQEVLSHTFATMQTARRVRITTTASPSWAGWFEIQFKGC